MKSSLANEKNFISKYLFFEKEEDIYNFLMIYNKV